MSDHTDYSGDYLEDDGADWWHQQDLELSQYEEELLARWQQRLVAIHDRLELDRQQAQTQQENDHATDL